MKKILIVPDIPGWVMESVAFGLVNSKLKEKFDFTIKYADKISINYGKELINWEEDYQKYDIIYLMLSGYLPENLPDYSKIITSFHGGPGSESQANDLQRRKLTDMRVSYVSHQTAKRVISEPFVSAERVKARIINYKKIDYDWLREYLAIRDDDELKVELIDNIDFNKQITTNMVKAKYTKYGFGLTNLHFTPYGVDVNHFNQNKITDKFVCGYAGWVRYLQGKQKEHRRGDWILKAFEQKKFKLSIAGGLNGIGSGIDEIKIFQSQNKEIKSGLYNRKQMKNYYSELSCYLVPDKYAGGPMPVLEAGAMGIPMICTNAGHCGDFIEHDVHGKMINTYEEFVEAIMWMKHNPNKRKEMGINLKEYIFKNRTWDAVAPYWEKFFN